MIAAEILDEVDVVSSAITGDVNELYKVIASCDENKELIAQCYANWHGISIEEAREMSNDALHFINLKIKNRDRLLNNYLEALRNEAIVTIQTQKIKPIYYYEVHVNFGGCEGYSIAIKSDISLSEDEAIQYCVYNKLFSGAWDADYVDYVVAIDEEEFNDIRGV